MMTRSTGRFRKPIRAFISYRRLPSTALAHLIANELKRLSISVIFFVLVGIVAVDSRLAVSHEIREATAVPTFQTFPTSIPTLAAGTEHVINGIAYVYVPAGCFMMGSAENDLNAYDPEKPQHQVCITKSYWIGKFEVTNAEYQRFIDAGGYGTRNYWSEDGWIWKDFRTMPRDYNGFTEPDQPRVGITWYEAEALAKWAGGRLPTEAEWEYAARGPYSPIYPWGDEYKVGYANVDERDIDGTFLEKTAPVDSYLNGVSWVGAYNMVGNVWEWCADWYWCDGSCGYDASQRDDPTGVDSGDGHVMRGGSWDYSPRFARAAYRQWSVPHDSDDNLGVRLVVDAVS
ncbi:MAG: formylglycine-generating enzyme family protein [Anaerolineae bacterium]|nr:formylglycine-generating enzyme family protein [Anaerolineae bacterium]